MADPNKANTPPAAGADPNKANTPPASDKPKSISVTILKNFHDIKDFGKVYKEGEEVSGFTTERITELKKAGLVK